jgi:hypothetical protein
MNLEIGSRVRWESAAGVKRGTIKNIFLAPASNGVITPWIDIELEHGRVANHHLRNYIVTLCASASNLMMMQVALVA